MSVFECGFLIEMFFVSVMIVQVIAGASVQADEAAVRANVQSLTTDAASDQVASMIAAKIYGEALSTVATGLSDMEDLKMEKVRNYWERRNIRFDETVKSVERKIALNRIPMMEKRARTLAVWERTFSDPEASQFACHSGRSLNMILDQLSSSTTLSYAASPPSGVELSGNDFKLGTDLLDAIRLEVKLAGGPSVITLRDTLPARFDWWPYLLREPEFSGSRESLTFMREQLARQVNVEDKIEFELLKQMESEVEKLVVVFYKKFPPSTWKNEDNKQLKRLYEAEGFLKQSDREVARLANLGDRAKSRLPNYLATTDARNVTTLCHWMLSHGLRFAPAAVGDEPSYSQLFGILSRYCAAGDISPNMQWVEAAMSRPQTLERVRDNQ